MEDEKNEITNNETNEQVEIVSTPPKKSKKGLIIGLIIALFAIITVVIVLVIVLGGGKKEDKKTTKSDVKESAYKMSGNGIEDFDLYFLQLENKNKNMVYSPLSIKYALAMLNEGTSGDSKAQITSVIGDYKAKKYVNSSNMSLANALFINNNAKNAIKSEFIDNLSTKFNAEVLYDNFDSPKNINDWISNKTLNLINNMLDEINKNELFVLVNALGIDMEWKNKFIANYDYSQNIAGYVDYAHEKFGWYGATQVKKGNFENNTNEIATMDIIASFNNYDIVKTLGEDNIRKTVGDEYRKFLKENYSYMTNDQIEKEVSSYLDDYIKSLNSNYKDETKTTDFTFYVDDSVKVFEKDLKEYNGTTLQYVAIMPTTEELSSYIKNINASKVNDLLSKLVELKCDNFKDGVITKIQGTIPKFKFEYDLDLIEDLKSLGITDIFTDKADLSGLTTDKSVVISDALHKANIEFTQEGIKASAATMMGGLGAATDFDYIYDVPVEEIDLTFDKPYMFLIIDKDTKEVWFAGEVYNPLLWTEDPDYNQYY